MPTSSIQSKAATSTTATVPRERAVHHSQRTPFQTRDGKSVTGKGMTGNVKDSRSLENSAPKLEQSGPEKQSPLQSPNSTFPQADHATAMVQLEKVSKLYRQGSCGLKDVSLSLAKGSFLFVTGPSGSGKTTLLKLLYGAERPSEGSITVNNQAMQGLRGDRLSHFRRQLGVVFQDYKLIPNRTVSENVAFALWAQGCKKADIARRLAPTLRLVGLQHKAQCFPHQLSGGEQQRVSLARAIVGTPPLILADEPTGNLDPENSRQVIRILNKLNTMGATIVVTTHDLHLVKQSHHPVIQLKEGQLSWLRK